MPCREQAGMVYGWSRVTARVECRKTGLCLWWELFKTGGCNIVSSLVGLAQRIAFRNRLKDPDVAAQVSKPLAATISHSSAVAYWLVTLEFELVSGGV
jgi:hypothetical protein